MSLEPTFRVMDRAGCASGTRAVAMRLWGGRLPSRPEPRLVRELYDAENIRKKQPSGSQDMIGLIYPGISRLDYDFADQGGVFPAAIHSINDPGIVRWLERVLYMLPMELRPEGYNPLRAKRLDPEWILRLGRTGKDCFEAIRGRDLRGLGASMNECMVCWEKILPHTVRDPAIRFDLKGILQAYQQSYAGAMYSGCGGGYLFVISDEPVPGGIQVRIRVAAESAARNSQSSHV